MSSRPDDGAAEQRDATLRVALAVLVLAALALRLHLLLRLNINWDEFHSLALVHDFLRGAALSTRQTFHVHLFGWLASVAPADEVAQILAARLTLFGFGLLTSGLLYVLARRFLSVAGALFSVLCYNALAEVIVHGASFRPDPMLTLLALAASVLALARRRPRAAAAAAGALLAFSYMLSPKTVFFAVGPALLTLAPAPYGPPLRRRLSRLALLGVSGLLALLLLAALHHQAVVPEAAAVGEVAALKSIAGRVFWTGYWFPGRHYLLRSLEQNALVWLLLAGGLALAVAHLRRPSLRSGLALPLLALALPLATLAFYRNSFPYFLACALAPAMPLCGLALERLRRLQGGSGRLGAVLAAALVLGVFGTGVANHLRQLPNGIEGQRQLIATVHRMFPEPVPYIDRCSMISTFPKVGFFMSTWGMENYARDGRPVLTETVVERHPPLLIANSITLNLLLPEGQAARLGYPLLPTDRRTLVDNYVHHWGAIFVAGKRLQTSAAGSELEILIPGAYTLEHEGVASIDGLPVEPGGVVELTAGRHHVSSRVPGVLTLRWGDRLYRPQAPPARRPIFVPL